MRRVALGVALIPLLAISCAPAPEAEPFTAEYLQELDAFWQGREQQLRAEGGWLSLVGLYWLEPGEQAFGTDPANPIVFPPGTAPPVAGRLIFDGERVELVAEEDVSLTIGGEPVRRRVLTDDNHPGTDIVELGRLKFHVVRRGDAFGLRLKDPESPARAAFEGIDRWPPDPAFRVDARFVADPRPQTYSVPTVTGRPAEMPVPGVVEFTLGGKPYRLLPLLEEPENSTHFFFIFKDRTTGGETYPAGRYLYADLVDGRVDLDFNKAYSPPCAYTQFATCPLPPRENTLDLAVRVGERYSSHHDQRVGG